MSISGRLQLAHDIVFLSEDKINPHFIRTASCKAGDHILTRTYHRTPSVKIDSESARLLKHFLTANTIANAIFAYSIESKTDPVAVLDEALPLIEQLLRLKYLKDADQPLTQIEHTGILPGTKIGRWSIICSAQEIANSSVYKCSSRNTVGALKLSKPEPTSAPHADEVSVIKSLPAGVAPSVLSSGTFNSTSYFVTEWIDGDDILRHCNALRRVAPKRVDLTCESLLRCYASLEVVRVLHGDIHPRNVLVAADNDVRLVDFGLARSSLNSGDSMERAGVAYFFDPEYSRYLLLGSPESPPPYSTASEQFGIAAMLYLLLTGWHYLDFRLDRHAFLRQISNDEMLSFAYYGLEPRPAVEVVLRKALSRDEESRYQSIGDLSYALTSALREQRTFAANQGVVRAPRGSPFAGGGVGSSDEPLDSVETIEAAAFHNGAAGIAYAHYREACITGNSSSLAFSDVWIAKAQSCAMAARKRLGELVENPVGARHGDSSSLHFGALGIYCVATLVAMARADALQVAKSADLFIDSLSKVGSRFDLTDGLAGAVVACATLLSSESGPLPTELDTAVSSRGRDLASRLSSFISGHGPIDSVNATLPLGIAHGWAGALYGQLRWIQTCGNRLDLDRVLERVDELVNLWARREVAHAPELTGNHRHLRSSWCNGSAGLVHLLALACETSGEARFLEPAKYAAEVTWSERRGLQCLCCGAAGGSYALARLYRVTSEKKLRDHARELQKYAATTRQLNVPGLYKGNAGIHLLTLEMDDPRAARMPLFD